MMHFDVTVIGKDYSSITPKQTYAHVCFGGIYILISRFQLTPSSQHALYKLLDIAAIITTSFLYGLFVTTDTTTLFLHTCSILQYVFVSV